jgi:hypothetical protein
VKDKGRYRQHPKSPAPDTFQAVLPATEIPSRSFTLKGFQQTLTGSTMKVVLNYSSTWLSPLPGYRSPKASSIL